MASIALAGESVSLRQALGLCRGGRGSLSSSGEYNTPPSYAYAADKDTCMRDLRHVMIVWPATIGRKHCLDSASYGTLVRIAGMDGAASEFGVLSACAPLPRFRLKNYIS